MVEKYVCAVTPMGEVRLTLRSRKMAQLYLKLATLNRTPPTLRRLTRGIRIYAINHRFIAILTWRAERREFESSTHFYCFQY